VTVGSKAKLGNIPIQNIAHSNAAEEICRYDTLVTVLLNNNIYGKWDTFGNILFSPDQIARQLIGTRFKL
jgi:hypothetical protein